MRPGRFILFFLCFQLSANEAAEHAVDKGHNVLVLIFLGKAIRIGKEQGKGAVSLRGKMIDAPIVARAMQTIEAAEELGLGREEF